MDHPARPAGGLRAGRDDRGGRGRHAGRRARTDPGRGRPGVAERRTERRDRRRRDRERRVEPATAEVRRAPRHGPGGRDRHRRRAAGAQRGSDREERDRVRPPQARRRIARDARRDRAGRAEGAPAPPRPADAAVRGRPRARARARGRGARFDLGPRDAGGGRAPARGLARGGRGADDSSLAGSRRRPSPRTTAVPARATVGGDARSSPRPRSRPRGSTRRPSGTRGVRSPASGSRGSGSGRRTASSASSATAFGRRVGSRRSSVVPVVWGTHPSPRRRCSDA